jgi:hypothetical protein
MEKGAAIIVKFNWHGTRQSEFWTFDFFRSKYRKRIDSEKKGGLKGCGERSQVQRRKMSNNLSRISTAF